MSDDLKPIVLTFGYGINRRSRPQDIDEQECYDGANFDLSHQFFALHRRNAFSLITMAPNGEEIRGFAQLVNRDNSVSTLIQAGGNVYHLEYDDDWIWTLVGTVLPTARLRGPRSHNWLLDQYVIITDLEKVENVKKWDGATFGDLAHNLTSDLKAKFCRVHGERAYIGNVETTTDTPHVILASKLGDAEELTVTDRPASALNDEDPFFLPTPDLRPVNGVEKGFGQLFFSTSNGQLHRLSGSSAKDFELISFYEGSAISGDEAIINIGNDILMGLEGRIETLSGTLNFGDVETDDVSQWIKPLIEEEHEWTISYNRRLQKAYCLPESGGKLWVLHKSVLNALGVQASAMKSPWSKWTTEHEIAFSTSMMWGMIDPESGHEDTYVGDHSGRVYHLEGHGTGQDGAATTFIPTAVDFSIGGYLKKTSNFSGLSDGPDLFMSFWIKPKANQERIFGSTAGINFLLTYISVTASITYQIGLAVGGLQGGNTGTNSVPPDVWSHVMIRFDATVGTPVVYINNAAATLSTTNTNTGTNLDLTLSDILIGNSEDDPPIQLTGCLSEFWMNDEDIDITDAVVRAKFIDGNGKPVNLGTDGSTPTGTEPVLYLKDPASTFNVNSGTGGDMTIAGTGVLVACGSNPSGIGSGSGGGIPTDITVFRRSKIINLPGFDLFNIKGWITYLKAFAATVTLTFEYGGTNVFDQSITVKLPADAVLGVYNGEAYYNGDFYYNAGFEGRLKRQKFSAAGQASFCQVKVEVEGAEDIELHEIGLWFSVAKDN